MEYHEKYLKYKNKYLQLKSSIESIRGGSNLSILGNIPYNINLNSLQKTNKSNFALAINYKTTDQQNRHITLGYFTNFPLHNNEPVKSVLSSIIQEWYNVLNNVMPKGGYKNYDISKSNNFHYAGSNSVFFVPKTNMGIIVPTSLESLIQNFHNNLNNLKINKSWQLKMPHSINILNLNVSAHSDLKLRGQQVSHNLSTYFPTSIDLRDVNIY